MNIAKLLTSITNLLAKPAIGRFLVLLVLDIVLFGSTNAKNVASPLLIVGFGLLIASLYYAVRALLSVVQLYGIRLKQRRRLAVYLTALLAGIIALQSIGELSQRDIAVLLPLAILGYLYSFYGVGGKQRPLP